MKSFKQLYSYVFVFILSFVAVNQINAQTYTGDVTLTTQAELVTFASNNFSEITGKLKITGSITDLTPLVNLTTVGGNLDIYDLPGITSLDGLDNLKSVGGNITIGYTSFLSDINGLKGITIVNGNLIITNTAALPNLSGFVNLITITGNLEITANSALASLEGLNNLTTVSNNLNIINNSAINDFCALYTLLNSNGLGGTYNVSGNNYNPTEQEIINGGACPALPVELTTFSANINENNITLNWQTATEVNNYGFQVQRKMLKDQTDWEKVSFVQGHGNSNSPKYYSFTDNSVSESGKYAYRLKQIDIDGKFEYSDEVEVNMSTPNKFELSQNYPNPFNPTTQINFSIPKDGYVTLTIYDVLGNTVSVLENGNKSAGTYSYNFDASKLTSGIYFYTIKAGNFTVTKKMLLMK